MTDVTMVTALSTPAIEPTALATRHETFLNAPGRWRGEEAIARGYPLGPVPPHEVLTIEEISE